MTIDELIERDRIDGYRPCVRMALTHQGQVLLVRKASWHTRFRCGADGHMIILPKEPDWHWSWDMPQGGIEPGETIEAALVRESGEEIGEEWVINPNRTSFLYRDVNERPVEKDGRRYRGKTYYICSVPIVSVPEAYADWVWGPHGDSDQPDPLPCGEYHALLMNAVLAKYNIQRTQRGKASALLRTLSILQARNEVSDDGNGCRFLNIKAIKTLPPDDPFHEDVRKAFAA